MANDLRKINFSSPSDVTGLTSGKGNIVVGLASGLTERTVGTDGQILLADSADPSGLIYEDRFQVFMAYTTTDTNIDAGFTPIPWDVEQRSDSIYTHSTVTDPDEITVTSTGDYWITVDITVDETAGAGAGARSKATARILNNGVELTGSRTLTYHRLPAAGGGAGPITYVESLTSGDVITVEASRLTGTGTLVALSDHCRIAIRKI